MVRGLVLAILYFAAIAGILFVSAGRLDWPMGWAFLGVSIVIGAASLFAVDPELINERSQVRAGVDRSDMALAGIAFVFCVLLTLLVTGLDKSRTRP